MLLSLKRKKVLIILIFINLFNLQSFQGFAFSINPIDSLEQKLQFVNSTDSLVILNKLGKLLMNKDYPKSRNYAIKALELAKKENNHKEKAKALNVMGVTYYNEGLFEKAIEHYLLAQENYRSLADTLGLSISYNNIGNALSQMGKYQESIDAIKKSVELSEKINDTVGVAYGYVNIGGSFNYLGKYEKAIESFFKSIKLLEELRDYDALVVLNNKIGTSYSLLKENKKAIKYHYKAIQILQKHENKWEKANTLLSLGNVFLEEIQLDSAYIYYTNAKSIYEEIPNQYYISLINCCLADVLVKQKQISKAIKYYKEALVSFTNSNDSRNIFLVNNRLANISLSNNENAKAEKLFLENLKIANETQSLDLQSIAYKNLFEMNEKQANYKASLGYFKQYKEIKDSMFNVERMDMIKEIEIKYETEKKEKELLKTKAESQLKDIKLSKAKIQIISIVIISLLVIIALSIYIVKNKEIKKKEEEKLKEKALSLEKEIELKTKKITCELNNFLSANNIIDDVIHKLSPLQNTSEKGYCKELNHIISNLKTKKNNGLMVEFEKSFTEVHQSFYDNLRNQCSDLSSREIRLCALIKCGMRNMEIAELTNVKASSIDTARSRIKKKLQLNTQENLSDFLVKL